jgi:hypothetical protein
MHRMGAENGSGQTQLLKQKRRKETTGEGLSKLLIRREEARHADTRDQDRHRLRRATFPVTYRNRKHSVELVNLSGGGAMIDCRFKPDLCERIDLHLGDGGSVECLVRWVKDGRIGLEFAHETQLHCSGDEQAALLREVINRDFPDETFEAPTATRGMPEQRSNGRHPLIWSGALLCGPNSWKVRLRNVSPTGAMIECEKTMGEGTEVVLDLGEAGSVAATVSWALGDHLGLRFDEPFNMRGLARSKPHVAPATGLSPPYLNPEVTAELPHDDAWGRMSIDDLRSELEGFLKR